MTAKQQIATGLLAALIVCSVAFMPANADSNSSPQPLAKREAAAATQKVNTDAPKAPPGPPGDLTYN